MRYNFESEEFYVIRGWGIQKNYVNCVETIR